MHPDWQNYLASQGAVIDDGLVRHFGDPQGELSAAGKGGVLADLSRFGLLTYTGEDATTFLHGQFTNNVKGIGPDASQYGGYCTAQGRMLASFLMWRTPAGYAVQLPSELLEPIRKRLSFFILRARVKSQDASASHVRLGLSGDAAQAALAELGLVLPEAPNGVTALADGALLRLEQDRFELVVPQSDAPRCWQILARHLKPVGSACWEWLDIQAGIPSLAPATQEQFVPQMANLEQIGGLSFNKGCYPGQEIVARTQYLGKQKRRMYLARIEAAPSASDQPPMAGDALFGADFEGQASGMVMNAQPSPAGGYDLLAVVHSTSVEAGVRFRAPDGPPLQFQSLPYSV